MSKRIASSSGSENDDSDVPRKGDALNHRSNAEAKRGASSDSPSDSDAGRRKKKGKRDSRPSRTVTLNKKVIESGTSEEDSDTDVGQPSTSRKRKKTKVAKTGKKKARNGAAGGSEDSDKTEVDEYDDDMFLDEDDRRRLEEMTEKEREAEIFKRVEQREILLARHAIQKKIQLKKGDEGAPKKERGERKKKEGRGSREKELVKKKIEDSDEGEEIAEEPSHKEAEEKSPSPRGTSPVLKPKSEDQEEDMYDEYERPSELQRKQKQKSAMADLLSRRKEKREAEQKKKAESRKSALDIDEIFGKDDDNDNEKSSSSSSRSSSRSSSPSSIRSRSRSKSPEKKREVDSAMDLQRIRLSRFKLSKLVHTSFFAKTITGCFVRIGIGRNKEGRSVYRAAQILDVVETAKVYQLENTRTNKGIKLKHGKEERVYRLEFVSNSDFTDQEVARWLDATKSNNLPVITMDIVEKKELDIKKAMEHNFTEDDINQMIKEKARFKKAPFNYALEKGKLLKFKQEAEQYGHHEEAEELQRQIDELEARAAELDRRRTESIRGISWINQRNRQAMKDAILGGKVHIEVSSQDDPFTRKNARMKPRSGKNRNVSDGASPGPATTVAEASITGAGYAPKMKPTIGGNASESTKLKPTLVSSSSAETDLFKAHDFELDFDIVFPRE